MILHEFCGLTRIALNAILSEEKKVDIPVLMNALKQTKMFEKKI